MWLKGCCEVVGNDVVMLQVNQHRLRPRTKPRGQDEKEARAGTAAPTMESEAWRDHFGSVYGGPVRWQRIDKEATKDDRRTGRQTGGGQGGETRGDYGAGTSPAGALAHVPCCHTKVFFWAVPCALEAQTVINTSCFDWRFPRKREKVRQ